MSIIFGMLKPDGARVEEHELLSLATATERYAPEGASAQVLGRIGMGFQPYYTHQRSCLENAPRMDIHSNLLCIDGRLDNHRELCDALDMYEPNSADSQIVLSAFNKWGDQCFAHFVGDWAVALWDERNKTLYLARDHAGTRTLYFCQRGDTLLWATYVDTLISHQEPQSIDEDYVAAYLSSHPVHDLTPYKGVRAVTPAHYVAIAERRVAKSAHWNWIRMCETRYRSDQEYDDHFLTLFRQSVERRTGPGAKILAQLSGGMDSSSIVCMSDHIRRSQTPLQTILDTISFYDDSEPTLDDRPYFTIVENNRGKTGYHIARTFAERTFELDEGAPDAYLFPGADSSALRRESGLLDALRNQSYRVVLSGIGGDELLGGVPTPLPELADYLMSGNLSALLRHALAWSVATQHSMVCLLADTLLFTYRTLQPPRIDSQSLPSWITPNIRHRYLQIFRAELAHSVPVRSTPNALSNGHAWWSILETLPHVFPGFLLRPEYRYPYLDRDLVDFLFSIPREQLIRPGRRRHLMRRSLRDIVPREILERRRKAYQIRTPVITIQQSSGVILRLFSDSHLAQAGYINPNLFLAAVEQTVSGNDVKWWQAIVKTIYLELWFRSCTSIKQSVRLES